jgi:hypothetical protein
MRQTLKLAMALLVFLFLLPSSGWAQGAITPGTPTVVYARNAEVTVYWDPCTPTSAAPEDAIAKYELVAFTALDGGVRKTTWDGITDTTFAVPTSALDRERVYTSVRCWTAAGEVSGWSNTLPFVPAGIPGAPGRLRTTATAPQN